MAYLYWQLPYLLCKTVKERFPLQFLTTKIQTPQEEVRKSHEKYEIRILYFSCKYRYNISYKHLKQASQTHRHKGSKQSNKKKLTIYAATILRLSSTQQAIRNLTTYCFYLTSQPYPLATNYGKSHRVINNTMAKQLYYKDLSETINYTFIRQIAL